MNSLSNARTLGFALLEFEAEYGRFPDTKTAADVAERTGSNLAPPGTSANALLRQLIASGILNSETMCYAKTVFGHVTKGQDIVDAVAMGDTIKSIRIEGDTEALFKQQKEQLDAWNKVLDQAKP